MAVPVSENHSIRTAWRFAPPPFFLDKAADLQRFIERARQVTRLTELTPEKRLFLLQPKPLHLLPGKLLFIDLDVP